jgi:hypothetical protein
MPPERAASGNASGSDLRELTWFCAHAGSTALRIHKKSTALRVV